MIDIVPSFRKLRDEVLAQNIQGALDEVSGNDNKLNLDLNLDLSFDAPPNPKSTSLAN